MEEQLSMFESVEVKEKQKKRIKNPQIWMEINGQPIPYSFRKSIVKICGSEFEAARIFYRAEATGFEKPIAWICEGMKRENPYARKACKDEFDNPKIVQEWIKVFWYGKNDKGLTAIKEIFKNL